MKIKHALWGALLLLATFANAQTTYAPGTLAPSCNAVVTTGACSSLRLAGNSLALGVTWQLAFDTGTASAINVTLRGSNDNASWTVLDTSTSTSNNSRSLSLSGPYIYLDCNVVTYTKGTTNNLTCGVTVNPNGSQAAGSGIVSLNGNNSPTQTIQGSAGAVVSSLGGTTSITTQLGATIGSGFSTTFPASGTGFQQMARAPQNTFVSDNSNWGYGIDTAVAPTDRDFVLAYIQEGLPGLTPSDYDFVYAQYNAQYTTLSAPLTVGATSIPLTAALTIGAVEGGHQYVLIGTVSGSDQQMCTYVSGSGTTTFVVSNCYSVAGGTVAGSAFANPAGENVTILNDLAHQPTLGIGGDLGNPNMRLTVFGDTVNQPGMGGISLLGVGGTLGAANPLEVRSGVGYTSQLRWWVNQNYQMAVSANAVNRTGSDGITNTDTTFCSATAAFTPDDLGNFIVATNVPTGDYVITWTSATCVVLKVATTGTATALAWTLYEPYTKIMSAGSFPAFQVHPGAGAGALVATDLVNCFGAGCGALPTHTMEVRASGSNNATSSLQTASQGNLQQLCNGTSAKCTFGTTNSAPLALGTANCADATCGIQIQTDNRPTILKEYKNTGVAFASLDASPVAGEQVYCTDCSVTTAASCSTAIPASCVCAASGTGAFAKYMNYQGGGAHWYCQ